MWGAHLALGLALFLPARPEEGALSFLLPLACPGSGGWYTSFLPSGLPWGGPGVAPGPPQVQAFRQVLWPQV